MRTVSLRCKPSLTVGLLPRGLLPRSPVTVKTRTRQYQARHLRLSPRSIDASRIRA